MGWGLPLGTDHHVPRAANLYQLPDKRETDPGSHSLAVREPAPGLYSICGTPPYTHLLSAAYKTQHTELGTHFPGEGMVTPVGGLYAGCWPRGEDSVTTAIATLPGLLFMKHESGGRKETGLSWGEGWGW